MGIVIIPLLESAEYTMRIELDLILCDIRVYWNEFSEAVKSSYDTDGFWAMDLSNDIFSIEGIKLVGGTDLMWPYSHAFGGFIFYDMTGNNEDAQFEGIGERWQLSYIPIADIQSVRQELGLETI
ncbi:MAG: hypothetical protein Unbinned3818contig1000_56 [Prokaryotic dsDNA virus sp.]|nr:hypothetical protein [Phycisphaerae bacterium]QDP45985.1 MAG: hypothetical protein Unbinned3818contig1000_56 [Prokaryotic dsDNA virus sp.]